ncbi:MAG: helix-turn-helix transcriptional regulator [Oscillospiraceae bacterium]|nr:helix-turn-helix transcriptional regulator [Oscillospiraceae bacterium]
MLATQMKKLRHQKGLTQQELADYLHVSKGTVGMWETGRREPDIEILSRLADFYQVSVDYLIGREQISDIQQTMLAETIRQIETLNQLKEQLKEIFPQE